ncbi:MAG: ABC transporter ATP-binding protein [bacterium]
MGNRTGPDGKTMQGNGNEATDSGHCRDRLLEISDLSVHFVFKRGTVRAVGGVSLTVDRGRIVGLVGESGCGKSMTALSILGLIPSPAGRIAGGTVMFDDRDLTRLGYPEICTVRGKEIAMIFQEPMTSLNPVYTVGRQVGEAIRIHECLTRAEIRDRVIEVFNLVGIPEPASRLRSYPHQLSGGLRQRVMIAMAIICEPRLLIADEPTTALDTTVQAQILDLLLGLRERSRTSILLITHDLGVIAEVCDEVSVMYAGRIMEQGDVFALFDHPAHPYTQGLMRSMPGMAAQGKKHRLPGIEGAVPDLMHPPAGCRFHPRCGKAMPVCSQREPGFFRAGPGHEVRCWLYRSDGDSEGDGV